jgi:signal transduction histidine kinase
MRRQFVVSDSTSLCAREEERRRVLRDLHDGIGPTLAALALGLRAARAKVRQDTTSAERMISLLEDEVHGMITEIRRLADGLHPKVLDRLALVDAVRQYAATMSRGTIQVDVHGEVPEVPLRVAATAYRIVCEALTNVARHANARRCVVRLWLDGDLHVEIVDDGQGMAERPARDGTGLRSMRARATELGGDWLIEPVTSGGARVAARLPVSRR